MKKRFRVSLPIFWKLMLINALAISIVIWITGTSVKDFACDFMDYYLYRASLIAMIVAGFIHFYLTRKVVQPLKHLTESTKELSKGRYPVKLQVNSGDEIGQLTQQFNQLIVRLQQTEQTRNKLLADLAHELRTPLTNMTGYLEALSNGVIQGETQLYNSLYKEALRLTALIDKLYLLHDQEYRQLHHQSMKQRVNIKDVIEESLQLFEWEFKRHHIPYSFQLEEGYVYGDPDCLKQVFHNVLQNALQYRTVETEISCLGKIEQDKYYFSLTGIGQPIPEHDRDRVFERFYRVDPSRNRQTGGDGLGLSIVKEIVHLHGGEVGLETDGSKHTFWIRLPLISI